MEGVTVFSEKYKTWKTADEVGQITLAPKQLTTLPNLGEVDIFRSLQLLPGISGINDGSAGLYIRGGTPDQNLVLLDGMTVYHVDHFFGFFSAFNSEAIKDVQVYKGGFPAKYGGRLSSVVELTGKTGNVNDFSMNVGANLLSANALVEVPLFNKGSFLISARRSYADFLNSGIYDKIYSFLTGGQSPNRQPQGMGGGGRGFNQTEQDFLPSFYFYDLNAKLSYPVSNNDFISLSLYNGKDYLDESQDAQQTNRMFSGSSYSGSRVNTDNTSWGNLGYSAKWSKQWSDRFFSDALFSSSNYFNKKNNATGFQLNSAFNDSIRLPNSSFNSTQDNKVTDYTFSFNNDWNIFRSHQVSFGIWLSTMKTKYLYTNNDTTTILNLNNSARQGTFYLQDKFKPVEKLELNGGIRMNYYSNTKLFYPELRFSLIYSLLDNLKIKSAWGQYYQFVNHITNEDVLEGTRDFWLIADTERKPGYAVHYILGLEYELEDYLFSVEGYYKDLSNILEFNQRVTQAPRRIADQTTQTSFINGDGIAKGIEFLVQKKFGEFSGWLCYTLGSVLYSFPEINNGAVFPADHDRRHEIKFVGTYTAGNWNFSASWVYGTGKAYTAPESQYSVGLLDGTVESYFHISTKNSLRLPDYHRLDVSTTYSFKETSFKGEFGLSVYNLYNRKNVWYKKYDLQESPIVITNVNMLSITPTLFIKLYF